MNNKPIIAIAFAFLAAAFILLREALSVYYYD